VKDQIKKEIRVSIEIKELVLKDDKLIIKLESLIKNCVSTIKNGGKIIFCGNGGSFADAQHIVAEFISRLRFDRAPIAAIALGTNSSNLTAIGNDYGFDKIFVRELEALSSKKDLFIPISTSGNSLNIIEAIKYSISNGIKTIGLTGKEGGKMGEICEVINIPSNKTEKIQEAHIMVGHIVCYLTEKEVFKI
tara:strand:+ start:508 stop:1083 length:576 start_codon:yes stop_codon:yes gene_type:complete